MELFFGIIIIDYHNIYCIQYIQELYCKWNNSM